MQEKSQPEQPPKAPAEEVVEKQDQELPYSAYKMKAIPTMFGDIREKNVAFCVDTSGSMYSALEVVKEHLIEVLMQRAQTTPECMFNVIEFSTEVTQWSDKMVRCTPQTVAVAAEWIKKLQAKTGTNTMDALLTALSDPDCEAVCLVTDGHPDQNPTDILDSVMYASQNRPVHCFFIEQGNPDPSATTFLQDLGMETYGSFHVVTVTLHGLIERITPVYRAEMSAERIVRTTDGNIYPSNHKICSVATTLNAPLPDVLVERPSTLISYAPPLYPFYMYPYPYRYYYQCNYPDVGWSRYRPARSTLSSGPTYDDYVPGAGSMLIGMDVLARRNSDGYFYVGNVKSQILENKFLVEFGPCKHGKYKETIYQETFVHDIVSLTDALRHSVCVGDKVLAPWEPEGDRHGPGVVIEGQEKRIAQGGGPDQELVVSFNNGTSAKVPKDTAVWIPYELHERITFELQLPKKVRCEFAEQNNTYPETNHPGYPVSGPKGSPEDFQVHESGWIHHNNRAMIPRGSYLYSPYCVPMYPVYYKQQPKPSEVKSEEIEKVIPGTEMTKDELNEKVMSQLMNYKLVLEDKKNRQSDNRKLLRKREKLEENIVTKKSLDKSVSFKDADSDLEPEVGDLEMRDSGRGSQTDADLDLDFSDIELDEDFNLDTEFGDEQTREAPVGTDPSLFYPRRSRRVKQRPRWRYWNRDPAPELLDPMHEGPYRVGPFEEPMTPIPWVMKTQPTSGSFGGGWSKSTMTQYADYLAKYKRDGGEGDHFHVPRPPSHKPTKQGPGHSVSEVLHGNMSETDKLAQQRLDNRRRQVLKREDDWHNQYVEGEQMKTLMVDQHRERMEAQANRDNQRHLQEVQKVHLLREAKKEVNEQVRARIEGNQDRERAQEEQRFAALQARRARREDVRWQREAETEDIKLRREDARRENAQGRWDARRQQTNEREAQEAARNEQAQAAKSRRFEQFRQRENEALRIKQLQAERTENKSAAFRSQIFS